MTLWRGAQPLILASKSPARQALLANAGLVFEAIPADVDERAIQRDAALTLPRDIALMLARAKATAVSSTRPGRVVIGADQTLALGARLFNKPDGRAAAAQQLRALAGHAHQLYSAVSVAIDGDEVFHDVSVAEMTMRPLSGEAIRDYLDEAGEAVTTSVGAYQLEGLGVHLFERIDGDHFTVLGLPLLPLLSALRQLRLLGE